MTDHHLLVDGEPENVRLEDGACEFGGETRVASVSDLGRGDYSVLVGGRQHLVHVRRRGLGRFEALVGGELLRIDRIDPRSLDSTPARARSSPARRVKAPMPGKVLAVRVAEGDEVSRNDPLAIVEAMKMQNELRAPEAGQVAQVQVQPGDSVSAGQTLVVIE